MSEQISLLAEMWKSDNLKKKKQSTRRRWNYAFQKWSDEHGLEPNNTTPYGCCGYGSMCDWCKDNSFGRPCVRALNAMCKEKGIRIDYNERNNRYFEKVWRGEI